MSRYVTASRGHDAEWHLQYELTQNDYQLRTGRTQRRGDDRHGDTWLTLAAVPPVELAAAEAAVRRLAAPAGETAVAELLEALGLTAGPAPATPRRTGIGRPRRQTAACHECDQPAVRLRADGTLTNHSRTPGQPSTQDRCPGSRRTPRTPERPAR
ncbi:hypothetical protein GCM10017673_40190 [Streptosporangium violaceochromogenes]|nr:hypothetical protein GCM10017673_40190 [Streptosporangium violaceochromogenes]